MSEDVEVQMRGASNTGTAERMKLSTPGLRAFHAITEGWGLGCRERCTLLGDPSVATYQRWMRKVGSNRSVTLSKDTLIRISAVLGIHKLLTSLFIDPREALTWLQGTHNDIVFAGQSPLNLMLNGTQDDLLTVRRYLEAWPFGANAASTVPAWFNAVKPEDIVFL
jgi:hypothetical protein